MCTEHYHWHHDYVRLAWDSGFSFASQKTKLNLDLSSISIIDVERVTRDRDVAVIEKHISSVINYHLEEEQTKILDPTFVKVFKLGQLSIQYLQFCKRYLDNTVVLMKKELAKYKEESNHLNEYTSELKIEISDLKEKVKELRSLLQSKPIFNIEDGNGFRCTTCSKIFLTEEYLTAHVKRRHENTNLLQSETDKLQLEIKELKERLNTTEKFIQNEQNIEPLPDNDAVFVKGEEKVENLVEKFEELKKFIEKELTVLRGVKNYEDKYERWFEMLFERLDNSQKELHGEKADVRVGGGDFVSGKAESGTQTVLVDSRDSGAMTDKVEAVVEDRGLRSPVLEVDVQKMQENLISNTENHLGQMQNVLEQKLSGGLQQIQTQMNTFWKKINDLEEEKTAALAKRIERQPLQKSVVARQRLVESSTEATESIDDEDSPDKTDSVQPPKPAPRITKRSPTRVTQKLPLEKKVQSPPPHERKARPLQEKKERLLQEKKERLLQEKKERSLQEKKERSLQEKKERSPVKIEITKKARRSSTSSEAEDESVQVVRKRSSSQSKEGRSGTSKIVEVLKKPEVRVIYDKGHVDKIENRLSVSGTETESEEIASPKVKTRPSTSTLGRRSISSLKQEMKDDEVLSGLRKELDEMISLRMKEIGVSPLWKGIPERSYFRALEILQHQAELTAKKFPRYWNIRDKILRKVSNAVRKSKKSARQKPPSDVSRTTKIVATKIPRSSSKKPQQKKPKPPVEVTPVEDLSSDDSNFSRTFVKPKAQPEPPVRKQSLTENHHQKQTPTATPVKKKVLFDLEDSSSTSKTKSTLQKNFDEVIRELEAKDDQLLNFTIVKSKEKLKSDSEASQKVDLTAGRSITTVFKIPDGGSISSSPDNSVFEAVKASPGRGDEINVVAKGKDDVSDWDISDILD